MRELLVTHLVKEVLGPRNGINETMDASPLSEYMTGVLAPASFVNQPGGLEGEADIPRGEGENCEEDSIDVDIQTIPLLSPALDPTNRPPSIGLSFEVGCQGTPKIEVCVTWARYELNSAQRWVRNPRSPFLQTIELNANTSIWINRNSRVVQQESAEAEISIHSYLRRRTSESIHVTLYVVNRIPFVPSAEVSRPRTEHHVFQPQIRVNPGPATEILPSLRQRMADEEEQELIFLYRNQPVYAQGHLCSAVWKEIDPERHFDGLLTYDSCRADPPFQWPDGALLDAPTRSRFSPPYLRTEFVPIMSVTSPDYSWVGSPTLSPELLADNLSESWNISQLRNRLEPISTGYQEWIVRHEREIASLSNEDRLVASRLIGRCRDALARIRAGINILCNDEDARLAFCFANRALDLQSRWTREEGLEWRPFQLAFILMIVESIINPDSDCRDVCDLLWVPTGAGKTEAYLALAAFAMAYRRRRSLRKENGDRTGAGVSVISRYTLRLLTIQQFRRSLNAITACEFLRVSGLQQQRTGWRPRDCPLTDDLLWGSTPFSIGLWVGSEVTPNRLQEIWVKTETSRSPLPGALDILTRGGGGSEPAQVLNCPACPEGEGVLAIPDMGLSPGQYVLHFVLRIQSAQFQNALESLVGNYGSVSITSIPTVTFNSTSHEYGTLSVHIDSSRRITPAAVTYLWTNLRQRLGGVELLASHPSRLGYFVRKYENTKGDMEPYEFDIFCPNPNCRLHIPWSAGLPTGAICDRRPHVIHSSQFVDGNIPIDVHPAFRLGPTHLSDRIPIPAVTVDDQVYHRLPSMVVATVDKFARPAYEPKAAGLFGSVDFHHCLGGYYRQYHSYLQSGDGHPSFAGTQSQRNYTHISKLDPPDLILQDELHLIEGPLGSLVGIYETAVESLCREVIHRPTKYVASTATVRRASEQIRSIFDRRLRTFPPPGTTILDRFFLREAESPPHPLEERSQGRLYLGICAPGLGPLIPIRNIWAQLLQTVSDHQTDQEVDYFWTLAGYFNAMRELGGVRALYRQDIQQRLNFISRTARQIHDDRCEELSSRSRSTNLPSILDLLGSAYPNSPDALFTTSMFGTGVDIPRISLMVVHGQPKTTSAYIQSTGRVGRRRGALVVTFYRSSRPRDLNHYELFCGYHNQLHRFVEPITAFPFSRVR